MKRILGLDTGTNSVGWAMIEQDIEAHEGKILGMGRDRKSVVRERV